MSFNSNNEELALRISGDSSGGQKSARELAAELRAAQKDVDNLKASFQGLGAAAQPVFEQELTKAQQKVAGLQQELKQLPPVVDQTKKSFEGLAQSFSAAGTAMHSTGKLMTAAITAPLVGIAAASVKAAVDFETAFAGVRKTVSGTPAQLNELNKQFRDMALTTPMTAVGLAQIGEQAGQLGVNRAHIAEFTKTIVDISAATHLTADEASTSFAKLANVLKMPQEQFSNLGSAVVALGNFGASTEQEMLAMGQRISAAGATAGMTAPQVLGIANALASVGINAEAGGTAISRAINAITKDVATGSGHLQAFAKVAGVSAESFRKAWHDDAGAAFSQFMQGLAHVREQGGDQLVLMMDELGFKETRMRNAFMAAANAGDLMRDSIELGTKAFAENTEIVRASEERYKTAANQLKIFWNNVTDLGIELGNTLLPMMVHLVAIIKDDFLPLVRGLVDWFRNLSQPMKDVVLGVGALAVALGPTVYIGGSLAMALSNIITLIDRLSGAGGFGALITKAPRVAAAIRMIVAAATGGVGLVVGAAGVGVAAAGAYQSSIDNNDERRALIMATSDDPDAAAAGGRMLEEIYRKNIPTLPGLPSGFAATGPSAPATPFDRDLVRIPGESDSGGLLAQVAGLSAEDRARIDTLRASGLTPTQIAKETGLPANVVGLYVKQAKSGAAAGKKADKVESDWLSALMQADDARTHAAMKDVRQQMGYLRKPVLLRGVAPDASGNYAIDVSRTFGGMQRFDSQAFGGLGTMPSLGRRTDVTHRTFDIPEDLLTRMGIDSHAISGTIMAALTGGGHVSSSIGGLLGGSMTGKLMSGVAGQAITRGLSGVMGSTIGAAVGSIIPGLGTMVGSMIGPLMGKLGAVFTGGEQAKVVNPARDKWFSSMGGLSTLNTEVLAATGSTQLVQNVFNAKTANDFKTAIDAVTQAVGGYKQSLAQAGIEEENVAGRLRKIHEITPDLQAALDRAFNSTNAAEYRTALAGISGILDEQQAKQQELNSTLQKYGLSWTELGDKAKSAHLADTASDVAREFDVLVGAGVNVNHVMEKMGPTIRDFVKDAQTSGAEVPESFRRIIQTAIDAGEVFDKNGNKITDMKDLGLKFGDTMATTMKTVGDQISHLADVLEHTLGAAFTQVADTATTQFGRIPKNIDVNVNTYRSIYGGDGAETEGLPSFDRRPLERVIKPGLAMLHPGDVVGVPPAGMLSRGSVTVNLHVEGNVLTERELMDAVSQHLADTFMQVGGGLPVNH